MSFLDSPTFQQSDPQAEALLAILSEAYDDKVPTANFVQRLGIKRTAIDWDGSLSVVWGNVLETAAKRNLLRRLVQQARDDADIAAFHDQLQKLLDDASAEDEPAPQSPFDYCRANLVGRRPFVNRSEFRDKLVSLLTDDGDQVLIIDGPPSSGRSYSWYLISHVGRKSNLFHSYLIDLSKWSDTAAKPADVARIIASELGWPEPAVDLTAQDETTSRTLLSWIKGQAKAHKPVVWLVFDGLDRPNVAESTVRFIGDIATAAGNLELGAFRVVLLAFGRPLPDPNVDPYVLRDRLTDLPLCDLRGYFQSVAEMAGITLTSAQVERLVERLLGAPPPDPIRVKLLGVQASELAYKLSRGIHG
jgi:hypothetical protein